MAFTAQKYCSFPIASITKADADGDIEVVGRCSDGQVDLDGDIVSPAAMASEVKRWLSTYPALRYQHRGDHPAGKGLDAWQDDQGSTWLKALVCDAESKRMVAKGVLRAFSVGLADVRTQKSARCPRYELVGFRLTEVSLVDSPSNARCGIEIIGKSAAGVPAYIGKAFGVAKKPKKYKVNKAHQALYDDPAAYAAWLVKQAGTAEPALDSVAAMFLNSSNPQLREMVSKALGGEYGPG